MGSNNRDWIKNFPSLVPKTDSKTVHLDLLGVAVVSCPSSLDFKSVSLSLFS